MGQFYFFIIFVYFCDSILILICFLSVFYLLALTLLGTVSTYQNVFIQQTAIRYTSESKWISLFPLELDVYTKHLDGVRFHQRQINHYLNYCQKEAQETDNKEIDSILKLLKGQMQYVTENCHNLRERMRLFKEMLNPAPSRVKRSLFPFLGDILHGLAGVPTEHDINRFNEKLNKLEHHDEELTHIVKDSLTIVNVTRYKLNHVSNTVNSMINAMEIFQELVYNNTENIYDDFDKLELEFRCWGHNSVLITTLLHNLNTVIQHIATLDTLFSDILKGQLTVNVLRPNQLKKLLYEIKSNIAQDLNLPYDIDSNLLQYYQSTRTFLVSTDQGPTIVVTIPLKSIMTQFHLYQITHVPIPYRNTSLLLQYDIPYPYIALSRDNTQIVYLSEQEYFKCIQPSKSLCHFKSPIRFTDQVKEECSAALLTQKTVTKCKVKLSPNTLLLPQSHWLSEGKWWIISDSTQAFTILCTNGTRYSLSIEAPIDVLTLPMGCKAQSSHLAIPPSYHHEEKFTLFELSEFIKYNISTYDKLVGHKIAQTAVNLPELLPNLVDKEIDIATLEKRIDRHLQDIHFTGTSISATEICLIVIIVLMICCFVILGVFIRFRTCILNYITATSENTETISLNESPFDISDMEAAGVIPQVPTNVFANSS